MQRTSIFLITIIAFIIVSGCAGPAEGDDTTPPRIEPGSLQSPPITPEPTPILPPELIGDIEIQKILLNSHMNWTSLHIIIQFAANSYAENSNGPDIQIHEIWIRTPGEFKVQISEPQGKLMEMRISNGNEILDSDGNRSDLNLIGLQNFSPPTEPSDTVVLHPLSGLLGTPTSDLIFPTGLAQRGGEYRITGQEIIAGREATVVEWGREPGELIDRFWVDRQTGIILRQQNYGKEKDITPLLDIQATLVAINEPIPDTTFDLTQMAEPAQTPERPAAGTAFVTVLPQVMNVRSGPGVDYKVVTTVESGARLEVIGRRETNDWWKVVVGDQEGWVSALYVEFSGDADKIPIVNY